MTTPCSSEPKGHPLIDVRIEQLVMRGIDVSLDDQPRMVAALKLELALLLGRGGLSEHLQVGGSIAGIRGGQIGSTEDWTAAQIGRQIARAIHDGIGDTGSGPRRSGPQSRGDQGPVEGGLV